ncbi:MAG: TetR family transcriptional regulator [Rectinemataceae bacterium]
MRALTQTERRERQDALADHALALFSESGYAKLTIEAIARRAGVAKGSVFLAFASKEDLFLHAVGRRFEAWFGRLAALNPLSGQTRKVAAKILLTLRSDPLLLPLLGLVDPVLEQGCSPAGVLAFKEAMAKGLDKLTKIWATQAPSVPAKKWGPFFMQVYALTVGAWAVSEPTEIVREALAGRDRLRIFLLEFDELFLPLLEAQLAALLIEP